MERLQIQQKLSCQFSKESQPYIYFYPYEMFSPRFQPFFYLNPISTGISYQYNPQYFTAFAPNIAQNVGEDERCQKNLRSEAQSKLAVKQQKKQIAEDENTEKQQNKKQRRMTELENINDNCENRNLLSNSLKLALKNIRSAIKHSNQNINKIIEYHHLNYDANNFIKELDKLLPVHQNYIRPLAIRQIFENSEEQFSLILKIFIRKFFREQIYTESGKSTRMKKLIKAQHIKAGRKLIAYLFGQDTIIGL